MKVADYLSMVQENHGDDMPSLVLDAETMRNMMKSVSELESETDPESSEEDSTTTTYDDSQQDQDQDEEKPSINPLFTSGTYEGDQIDGVPQGRGTFTKPGHFSYCGDWENGNPVGTGSFKLTNGEVREGTWEGQNFVEHLRVAPLDDIDCDTSVSHDDEESISHRGDGSTCPGGAVTKPETISFTFTRRMIITVAVMTILAFVSVGAAIAVGIVAQKDTTSTNDSVDNNIAFFLPGLLTSEKDQYSVDENVVLDFLDPSPHRDHWVGITSADTPIHKVMAEDIVHWVFACGTQVCGEEVDAGRIKIVKDLVPPGLYRAYFIVNLQEPYQSIAFSETFAVGDEYQVTSKPTLRPTARPTKAPTIAKGTSSTDATDSSSTDTAASSESEGVTPSLKKGRLSMWGANKERLSAINAEHPPCLDCDPPVQVAVVVALVGVIAALAYVVKSQKTKIPSVKEFLDARKRGEF